MALANELLQHDARNAVLQYLLVCRPACNMIGDTLDRWIAQLRDGLIPELGSRSSIGRDESVQRPSLFRGLTRPRDPVPHGARRRAVPTQPAARCALGPHAELFQPPVFPTRCGARDFARMDEVPDTSPGGVTDTPSALPGISSAPETSPRPI
jgi:hypothetical protein